VLFTNENGTQVKEPMDVDMTNADTDYEEDNYDAPANEQGDAVNLEVASGTQVTRRSTTSLSIARVGR
jgi:hypothetical protein